MGAKVAVSKKGFASSMSTVSPWQVSPTAQSRCLLFMGTLTQEGPNAGTAPTCLACKLDFRQQLCLGL